MRVQAIVGSLIALFVPGGRARLAWLIIAVALVACRPAGSAGDSEPYDLLISGGTVIDGTGSARVAADVAVRGDRIALVSRDRLAATRARRVIDATGKVVAPGF